MKFFNIDKALELPQKYKVLMEAMDELYEKRQEEFQKSNPLNEIYQVVKLNQFQKSFGSSTGFTKAFEQTVDYADYPGFTNGDGFRTTVSYKTFNGKVVFTWQMLLEADYSGIKDALSEYQIAWQRQIVQFGMFALTAMFGEKKYDKMAKSWLKIDAADTTDGDPMTPTKNPVFFNKHNVVRKEDMSQETFEKLQQSNKFYIDDIALDGSDPLAYAKLANGLHQIKTIMAKYKDDNGQFAGVNGRKKLVMTEDAQLTMAIESIMNAQDFSVAVGKPTLNPVKNAFDRYYTPYLDGTTEQPIEQFATEEDGIAHGILMLDQAYNKANHGPMMVERLGFTMKGIKTDIPEGMTYTAKQAFDFCCPAWRGIAYIYIGKPKGVEGSGTWNDPNTFTKITPISFATPVAIVNTVTTKTETAANE